MNSANLLEVYQLSAWVKEIFLIENNDENKKSVLPFYADGFPGVIFKQSHNDAILFPKNKKLSGLFLYGQTLQPIEIVIEGKYKLIVFQIYPFLSKLLFNVNPAQLNNDCYNLLLAQHIDANTVYEALNATSNSHVQMEIICNYLKKLIDNLMMQEELKVIVAVNLILQHHGNISVKYLLEQLFTTERTLQRQFEKYVGISPKMFAKIIQFQSSLSKISGDKVDRLTDIVFDNGYADQSHFIRSFKKFTGKKPSDLKK